MDGSQMSNDDSSTSSTTPEASPALSDQTNGSSVWPPYEPAVASLNIYQRLLLVKREVTGVDKKGKHSQGFRFVTHDDVTAALSGLFVKYGIDREVTVLDAQRVSHLAKDGTPAFVLAMRVQVAWVNVDNPGERKCVEVFAEGVDNGTRRDGSPNIDGLASGKAISYAVKMAELKNFCLTGETTQDNERAQPLQEAAKPVEASDYQRLVELYKSCSTKEELTAVRGMIKLDTLSKQQVEELSALDHQAKARSK